MTKQNTQMFHKGWTRRLREAIRTGDENAMEAALKQKADPNGKIAGGLASFLDHAAARSGPFAVTVLLEFGAIADAERVRYLARTKGEIGYYPIHMAVFRGYTKALTRLLDARVDVDALCPCEDATALTVAVMFGSPDMVRLLLAAGADIEHRTVRGATALWLACKLMKVDVARALLEAGARLDVEAHEEVMADGETMPLLEMVRDYTSDEIESLVYHHKQLRDAQAVEQRLAHALPYATPSATTRRARM